MKIAFFMDSLESIDTEKDTSFIIMMAALERGHQVYHFLQDDLEVEVDNQVVALVTEILPGFKPQSPEKIQLSEMNCIFIRKDPPFDRRYFYTTLILDMLPPSTRILNSSRGIRDWNEKLCALRYPQYVPKTLVSQNTNSLKAFVQEFNDVILKPIDGFGGQGILRVKALDPNLDQVIKTATLSGSHKILANEYIPEAEQGDKRILIVNGEPIGAILRVAQSVGQLNNLDQGGVAQPIELSDFDQSLCEEIKPDLLGSGLFFVGLDLLGERLTEINVTSPTGLQELIRFSEIPHHHMMIQALEAGL